jgi:DNA-binding HxlR family transcriptional regulator
MTDTAILKKEMPPYNVFDERCPTRDVLARIADKWALLILARLQNGPMRFNQLQRDIQRITKKVLTQSCASWNATGWFREVFATVPVTVEYSLTPLGQALTETVTVLAHWVESNMDAIVAAQSAYDAANAQA